MKIFNYMNNTNSIMEKNTDKVQKGNSQTNEKHTVGQSVKLSISNEGLEYYRNRIQQSGQEKYDDVVQRKELLASKKISDIDYSYEIQKKAAQQNQNVDTGKSALNITDKANNYVKAYAELLEDILEVLKKQPKEHDALEAVNAQLKQTLNELMKINENNKLLTKESLDMVEFELNIAKNAVLTPQTGNYSKNAYDEERIQTVSGFDARQ